MRSKLWPAVPGSSRTADEHRGDVFAGNAPAAGGVGDRHAPGPRVIGEHARPHYGRRFNAVRARIASSAAPFARRYAWKTGSSAVACGSARHRGDHQIPVDTRGFGGVGQQDRGVAVDGLLARRAAARDPRPRRTRRRRRRAGVRRPPSNRGALQIHDNRFGARRFEVGGLRRVADESGDGVAALREQALEDQRDLSVSARDDDAHALPLPVGAQRRWRVGRRLSCMYA